MPLGLAVAFAIAACTLAPRAYEAQWLLAAQDDPAALADHAIARSFTAASAEREINAALAANDADLAKSFLELASDQKLPVDPALAKRSKWRLLMPRAPRVPSKALGAASSPGSRRIPQALQALRWEIVLCLAISGMP